MPATRYMAPGATAALLCMHLHRFHAAGSPPSDHHHHDDACIAPGLGLGARGGTYQALLLLEVGAQAQPHAARRLAVDDAPLEQAALLGAQARVVGVAMEHHRAPVLLLVPCERRRDPRCQGGRSESPWGGWLCQAAPCMRLSCPVGLPGLRGWPTAAIPCEPRLLGSNAHSGLTASAGLSWSAGRPRISQKQHPGTPSDLV